MKDQLEILKLRMRMHVMEIHDWNLIFLGEHSSTDVLLVNWTDSER